MIRLAVFDMDGTLLDTLEDLTDACNWALNSTGFPPCTAELCRRSVGSGSRNLIRRILPEESRDEETLSRVHEIFVARYAEHGQDKTRPYPGVPEMLRAVRGAGIATAILSNKPHAFTAPMAQWYFPGLIDRCVGQQEGVPIKPDPAALRLILRDFGVSEDQCVYVGDGDVDIRVGLGAGVSTIGVSWGFRTIEELLAAGAKEIVHKVEELTAILVDKAGSAALY